MNNCINLRLPVPKYRVKAEAESVEHAMFESERRAVSLTSQDLRSRMRWSKLLNWAIECSCRMHSLEKIDRGKVLIHCSEDGD